MATWLSLPNFKAEDMDLTVGEDSGDGAFKTDDEGADTITHGRDKWRKLRNRLIVRIFAKYSKLKQSILS